MLGVRFGIFLYLVQTLVIAVVLLRLLVKDHDIDDNQNSRTIANTDDNLNINMTNNDKNVYSSTRPSLWDHRSIKLLMWSACGGEKQKIACQGDSQIPLSPVGRPRYLGLPFSRYARGYIDPISSMSEPPPGLID